MSPTEAQSVIVAEESAVWPWQAEPYKLWSLLAMIRFRVASFATVIAQLRESALTISFWSVDKNAPSPRRHVELALRDATKQFEELSLSDVLRDQWRRLNGRFDNGADLTEVEILIREMNNNLMVELASAWFLMIPSDKREYYEQNIPAFGDTVAETFVDANRDIAAASRCFALDEWTAAVFHLMRVLEHGLGYVAVRLGLPPEAMVHENWKNVIDQIEKKVRELEAMPKSPLKSETLRRYSGAAVQFRYFKDAWRNHVSHSRANYDEREALSIWNHVREFMQEMAAIA